MQLSHNLISEHFKQLTSGVWPQTRYNSIQSSSLSSQHMIKNSLCNSNHLGNGYTKPVSQQPSSTTKQESEDHIDKAQIIQKLSQQLRLKQKQNVQLQQQIAQLKKEVEYLMKSLEKLISKEADENINVNKGIVPDRILKAKQQDLVHANKQIDKLKQWLKQEKAEVYRSLECIKMKDMLIENMESQLRILKEAKEKRKVQKQSVKPSQQDLLTKYKTKSKQLQCQVYQLTEQVDLLRNDNYLMKCKAKMGNDNQNQNIGEESLINRLHQTNVPNEPQQIKRVGFKSQGQLNSFLSSKIMLLQTQIQKLLTKIAVYEMQNLAEFGQ